MKTDLESSKRLEISEGLRLLLRLEENPKQNIYAHPDFDLEEFLE